MTTAIGAEAMTGFREVGPRWAVIHAFEDDVDHLLHDFIACGGYPQFPFLAIRFGDVDGSDRLELKLLCSHFLDNRVDGVQRKPINGLLVRARGEVSWG